jgi:hypothetical protein
VCGPLLIDTEVSSELPLNAVTSGLLSSEYPIAMTVSVEQVLADAESVNGD